MCEFCKNVDTGDDYKAILSNTIDCGIMGKLSVDVALCRKSPADAIPIMELGVCMDTSDNYANVDVPIKYCPMCGKELKEGD